MPRAPWGSLGRGRFLMRKVPLKCSVRSQQAQGGVNAGPNAIDENQAAAVLESQLPHKIVNLLFELVIVNNKLTILLGI